MQRTEEVFSWCSKFQASPNVGPSWAYPTKFPNDIDACRPHPINESLHFLPEALLANLLWLFGRIKMPVS